MQCNANFKQWFNIFLIISEAWQGYESKAYGVSNHNLKLQSKKLSRTRDIPNFPTQGWADTAFCTRNWSETYTLKHFLKVNLNICYQNLLARDKAVVDPGFPRRRWGVGWLVLFGQVFPRNCLKMKEIGYFFPYFGIITKVGKAHEITADSTSFTPSTLSIINSSIRSYTW